MLTVKELVELLEIQQPNDFWYDVEEDIVEENLKNFTVEDWKVFQTMIPFNSNDANICLANSLFELDNQHALECVDKIVQLNNDKNVLRECIMWFKNKDKFSLLSSESNKKILQNKEEICSTKNDFYDKELLSIYEKFE